MTWSRYAGYIANVIDLSYFNAVIWQFAEFKIPYMYNPTYPVWSQHFSPILIFLAPIYWVFPNAGILMTVQALMVISGAYPVYLIGKKFLHSKGIGLSLAFAYLAFGGLQFGFGYGFHEIMFFPPLFLWAYYFYLQKNTWVYYLFLVLSLFVKEEVAFIVLFWGIYLLFIKRDRKHGMITSIAGILWYIICFNIVFPIFTGGRSFGYWGQYGSSGGIFGILEHAVFHPFDFLKNLVTPVDKIDTIFQVFGSFSLLLFLYPPSFLIVIPSLLEKLLSSDIAMANGAHYSAAITAVVLVATYEAFPKFFRYPFINHFVRYKTVFFAMLIMYIAFFSDVLYGYVGFSLIPAMHTSVLEQGPSEENMQLLSKIIASLPDNATIAAQYQIAPHIHKYYRNVGIWPSGKPVEDFIIIDTKLRPVLTDSQTLNKAIDALEKNDAYTMSVNQLGIVVFRKKSFTPQ